MFTYKDAEEDPRRGGPTNEYTFLDDRVLSMDR